MTDRMIVTKSATSDRVIVYETQTGKAKSYRPPSGCKMSALTLSGNSLYITSRGPKLNQFAVYNVDGGHWVTHDIRDLVGEAWISANQIGPVVPVSQTGSNITHLAVFNKPRLHWSVQALIEPIKEGHVYPIESPGIVAYTLGRRVYAFSCEADRWDVLTLDYPMKLGPEGLQWSNDTIALSQDGRLHLFDGHSGRWRSIEPKD
jgi:hypothetical protein